MRCTSESLASLPVKATESSEGIESLPVMATEASESIESLPVMAAEASEGIESLPVMPTKEKAATKSSRPSPSPRSPSSRPKPPQAVPKALIKFAWKYQSEAIAEKYKREDTICVDKQHRIAPGPGQNVAALKLLAQAHADLNKSAEDSGIAFQPGSSQKEAYFAAIAELSNKSTGKGGQAEKDSKTSRILRVGKNTDYTGVAAKLGYDLRTSNYATLSAVGKQALLVVMKALISVRAAESVDFMALISFHATGTDFIVVLDSKTVSWEVEVNTAARAEAEAMTGTPPLAPSSDSVIEAELFTFHLICKAKAGQTQTKQLARSTPGASSTTRPAASVVTTPKPPRPAASMATTPKSPRPAASVATTPNPPRPAASVATTPTTPGPAASVATPPTSETPSDSEETVTVPKLEWQAMQDQLKILSKQHSEVLEVLADVLSKRFDEDEPSTSGSEVLAGVLNKEQPSA
eukprot:gene64-12884_t